jgi:hypothetical protein
MNASEIRDYDAELERRLAVRLSRYAPLRPLARSRPVARPGRRHPLLSRRRLVSAGLALLLLAVIAPAVVAGLQSFGLVLMSPLDLWRVDHSTPSNAEPRGGPMTLNLSLEEAQSQVDFRIPTPAWLPDGVVFRGAFTGPTRTTDVVVSYRAAGESSGGLSIQIHRGLPSGGYVVPEWAAETVQVRGRPAIYARGGNGSRGGWDATVDAGLLSWQDDAFTYVLQFSGLGLSRDDLIRIAESVP